MPAVKSRTACDRDGLRERRDLAAGRTGGGRRAAARQCRYVGAARLRGVGRGKRVGLGEEGDRRRGVLGVEGIELACFFVRCQHARESIHAGEASAPCALRSTVPPARSLLSAPPLAVSPPSPLLVHARRLAFLCGRRIQSSASGPAASGSGAEVGAVCWRELVGRTGGGTGSGRTETVAERSRRLAGGGSERGMAGKRREGEEQEEGESSDE